ncbi:MAG: response regulator [Acidimicrobiaceae bacterium]|nr:response regulator [Acidimicrobiaceae bacterium]
MNETGLRREIEALRDRLSRLNEASLRIAEDLDLDVVLSGVADEARSLTGAEAAGLTTLDDSGRIEDFITSGLTAEERQQVIDWPGGPRFFTWLSAMPEPLRLGDLLSHAASVGLVPDIDPPLQPYRSFLSAPIRLRGRQVGNFYLGNKQGADEFSEEDEEILTMFASQAALAITNARRRRAEWRARADLETLIDSSPTGVAVFDARSGALVSYNREAGRIVGGLRDPDQSIEELLDVLIVRRTDGREVSLAEFPLAEVLRTGETVRAEEIVLAVPDGRSITTLVNVTVIGPDEGEAVSMIVTVQDMTSLEDQERLRAEFLAMVSHELRGPLASIKGSAAAALGASSRLDAIELRQFFSIIEGQADQMFDLISDLLDVARIEAGALMLSLEPTEVVVLVDQARNTLLSAGSRVDLRIEVPTDLPKVMVDRRRIGQVLGNLLSNAVMYSPESSPIRVTAVHEDMHVSISVADEGVGVVAERLPELFRKFSRLDASGPGSVGSGLGLAICKDLVEAHGGRIWAHSDGAGRGTRFTFTIPVTDNTAPASAQLPAQLGGAASAGAERILAVDDDPLALRYVRDALEDAGYAVTGTGDPREALSLMKREQPHLALLDFMLPQTDGIELMHGLLNIADIPVIFLSGYGRDEVIAKAFDMGADDYIVKPFSPTELTARIRTAIRRRAATPPVPDEPYVHGDLRIDYIQRRVTVAGQPVPLTATEYGLLVALSANAGETLTHQQILGQVWGRNNRGNVQVIRTCLLRLRRKLGDDAADPKYIFAEPRHGYRMPEAEA